MRRSLRRTFFRPEIRQKSPLLLRTQNLLILDPSTLSAAPKMADALMDMHRQCFRRLTQCSKEEKQKQKQQ